MGRKAFWKDYKLVKDLENDVKDIVNSKRMMDEFESELLSDLIADRHPCLSGLGLRPTLFRKAHSPEGRSQYEFQAYFWQPIGWQPTSWRKCCVKNNDPVDMIKRFFKKIFREQIHMRFSSSPRICPECGDFANVDMHHNKPFFATIFNDFWARYDESDIAEMLEAYYDDCFDDQLKVFKHDIFDFMEYHGEVANISPLCKKCHREQHRK